VETGEDDDFVAELRGELVLIAEARETTERLLLSARVVAEDLADKYKVAQLDAIDREQFAKELNRLKEKINLDGTDEVINGIVNSILLAAKVQRAVTMSSNAAALFVSGIADMLATREEERLVWAHKDVERRMYEVRAWSRRNGMQQPKKKDVGSEEHSLVQFLNNWKSPSAKEYGGECTDLQQSLVLLRDFPWFKKYVDWKDSLKSLTVEANKQLKDGFGWHTEPDFDGKKPLKSGSHGSDQFRMYMKIQHMIRGSGNLIDVEAMLKDLPESRVAWYRDQWMSKEKESKAAHARRHAERKRKREEAAAGAASSSVPEEEDEEDNDEEEEGESDDE
jgi:hypothetical protein